jgi:hypothetical protein
LLHDVRPPADCGPVAASVTPLQVAASRLRRRDAAGHAQDTGHDARAAPLRAESLDVTRLRLQAGPTRGLGSTPSGAALLFAQESAALRRAELPRRHAQHSAEQHTVRLRRFELPTPALGARQEHLCDLRRDTQHHR